MHPHYFMANRTSDIFNCNETSVTTVHVPPKVFAEKGKKLLGKVTSAERGVLLTMVGTISASGQYLLPYLIFPRKKFQPRMLTGAPANSAGGASPSGWVNQELTPEQVRPYPKAKSRVLSGRSRKKGSINILTDTPLKRRIDEHETKGKDKKAQRGRTRRKVGTVGRAGKANQDQTTKNIFVGSEGSDDEKMILDDDSDGS
ncbi:hypothetical protein QYM36_019261 [Artemia franciscana]|uniref:Uncharacterized protein n=1 Tax=Artemia franciscana TaxID=6661 RepID=A0AA88KTK7_ARTSF|nr:hypothetical protein QYM36_019261 [Artemia franciscana]